MKKLILVLVTIFSSCSFNTSLPVLEPEYNFNTPKIEKNVERAIIDMAIKEGWQIKTKADNEIIIYLFVPKTGVLELKDRTATAKISYNKEQYNIEYVSSSNLEYNKEDRTINVYYNSWINDLDLKLRELLRKLK